MKRELKVGPERESAWSEETAQQTTSREVLPPPSSFLFLCVQHKTHPDSVCLLFIVIEVFSEWCGPCKSLSEVLDQERREVDDPVSLQFLRVSCLFDAHFILSVSQTKTDNINRAPTFLSLLSLSVRRPQLKTSKSATIDPNLSSMFTM